MHISKYLGSNRRKSSIIVMLYLIAKLLRSEFGEFIEDVLWLSSVLAMLVMSMFVLILAPFKIGESIIIIVYQMLTGSEISYFKK